jgi:signal transduction histidine kinase
VGSSAAWDESFLAIAAVMLTGGWSSPFVVVLVSPIVAAGLLAGWAASGAIIAASVAGVAVAELIGLTGPVRSVGILGTSQWRLGLSWCVELGLLAIIGAYSRRLASAADAQRLEALSQLETLSRANDLLVELHQLGGAIPSSLTTTQVVDAALARLTELTTPDTAMVVLRGPAPRTWTVAASTGVSRGPLLTDAELPGPMRHCLAGELAIRNRRGQSLSISTKSAVYAPLQVGDRCLGLVALEWDRPGNRHRESQLTQSVAIQCAITLDNVRLVAALRSAGADDERHRIAEHLHDDVGQDLAVLALTLDRVWNGLGRPEQPPAESRAQIDELRQEARRILGHVRETLADLRSNVTEEHSLSEVLEGFLARVAQRSHASVSLDTGNGRVSLQEEREVWRIAQQAITNAERQAGSNVIQVSWKPSPGPAVLEVSYKGALPEQQASASQGGTDDLVSMSERAALIGAHLELDNGAERGMVVRCCLA